MKRPRRQRVSGGPAVVTIREVAARAGVSTATVSRVLGGLNGAGRDVRARVRAAARALAYEPNRLARGLRARHRKVVGVVIPDLQNPFFTGVVHGVEAVLCAAGYTLLLGNSDGLAERERVHFGVLRGEGAAGLILIPGNAPDADYAALRSGEVPVVAVDRSPRGVAVDLVTADHRAGARGAVAHLVALGHRGIALINGPRSFDVSRARAAGYREALAAAGCWAGADLVVHGDFTQAGGGVAMLRLLALARPPAAVLIANNLMTLGALRVIHERGIRIPDELAVVGFDDLPWAMSLRPSLTAVAQPAEDLGRTAAQLLLERLADPGRQVRRVTLPTRLMVRASCGAPAPAHSNVHRP